MILLFSAVSILVATGIIIFVIVKILQRMRMSKDSEENLTDKAKALKEWKRQMIVGGIFWLGFLIFVSGAFWFGNSFVDQGYSLTPPQFSQLHEANGILTMVRSGRISSFVVVDSKTSEKYSCITSVCSFENDMGTLGKPVKILAYEDHIYQIEVDNIVKRDYAERIKNLSYYQHIGIIFIILGTFVMILVQLYKRRQR